MTDNEIIKALECCNKSDSGKSCFECSYRQYCPDCLTRRNKDIIDLINHQKAEIERLHSEVKEKTETIDFLKDQSVGWSIDFCNLKAKLNTAKTEAVKEFVMRFEKKIRDVKFTLGQTWEIQSALKEVEKEMVGDENG